MSQQPHPTKKQRREAARAERERQEAAERQAAARRKRLALLGALALAAVAIVAIAIAISSGGGDDEQKASQDGKLAEAAEVNKTYAGIPQDGITLGSPDAPATVVVFADAKCPFCRDFDISELPGIVDKYVRPGKAKIKLRMRAFLGNDSRTAADAVYAAAQQDKAFQATGILYQNQGEETEEWVTGSYVDKLLKSVDGLDVAKAKRDMKGAAPEELLGEAETLAGRYKSEQTPQVYVGKGETDAELTSGATAADVGKAIDDVLAKQ